LKIEWLKGALEGVAVGQKNILSILEVGFMVSDLKIWSPLKVSREHGLPTKLLDLSVHGDEVAADRTLIIFAMNDAITFGARRRPERKLLLCIFVESFDIFRLHIHLYNFKEAKFQLSWIALISQAAGLSIF